MPTVVAFSIVNQWFNRTEGFATGCVTLGAAVGGIFFSLVLQALFARFSWRDAMLALSGILAVLMLLGNLLVKTNLKQAPRKFTEGVGFLVGIKSKVAELSRSPKFWLTSYAVFGGYLFSFLSPSISLLLHCAAILCII